MRILFILGMLSGPLLAADVKLPDVRSRTDVAKHFKSDTRLHVVNLWATWCIPCVAEMPDLQKVDNAFSDRDVEFIGVSLDSAIPGSTASRKALVNKFLKSRKITFKILYYIGKPSKVADDYDFDGEIPLTVVYDSTGKEVKRYAGLVNAATLTRDLKALLKR